jgi:erythromycin esterase-like protein
MPSQTATRRFRDRAQAGRLLAERLEEYGHTRGFYGLDLYSLHTSMDAVVSYLEQIDPEAARRARERYSCFDHFGPDPQVYAYEAGIAGAEPCEQQAVEQLMELHARAADATRDGLLDDADEHFFAEQNARLVVNAEKRCSSASRPWGV